MHLAHRIASSMLNSCRGSRRCLGMSFLAASAVIPTPFASFAAPNSHCLYPTFTFVRNIVGWNSGMKRQRKSYIGHNYYCPSIASRSRSVGLLQGKDILVPSSLDTAHFATSTSDDIAEEQSISIKLRNAYHEADTDGVLSISSDLLSRYSSDALIDAAIDAADGRSGTAASILNALLGGCVVLSREEQESDRGGEQGAKLAYDILSEWEGLAKEEDIAVVPDLVSYCLAYTALTNCGEYFASLSEETLDQALRLAKKMGGSKYRKARAQARRKGGGTSVNAADVVDVLQERYGSGFDILYENKDMVIVNKPSGMVCYHMRKTSAGKVGRKKKNKKGGKTKGKSKDDGSEGGSGSAADLDISLVDALSDVNVRLSNLNPDASGIVHRIDRGTSGCIVLAKTDEAHARLVAEFFTRGEKKTYDALVPANPLQNEDNSDFVLDLPDSGEIDAPVDGKSARSRYEVKNRIGNDAMHIQVETMTGRKHQVRVHCAKGLGRPLYLDPLYGPPDTKTQALPPAIDRIAKDSKVQQAFFLHASSLSFESLGIEVEAPLPVWWRNVLDELGLDAL